MHLASGKNALFCYSIKLQWSQVLGSFRDPFHLRRPAHYGCIGSYIKVDPELQQRMCVFDSVAQNTGRMLQALQAVVL